MPSEEVKLLMSLRENLLVTYGQKDVLPPSIKGDQAHLNFLTGEGRGKWVDGVTQKIIL